ncbi:MAG: hypothetical protein ACE5HC_09630 [Candidatus Binatia bacterium]
MKRAALSVKADSSSAKKDHIRSAERKIEAEKPLKARVKAMIYSQGDSFSVLYSDTFLERRCLSFSASYKPVPNSVAWHFFFLSFPSPLGTHTHTVQK